VSFIVHDSSYRVSEFCILALFCLVYVKSLEIWVLCDGCPALSSDKSVHFLLRSYNCSFWGIWYPGWEGWTCQSGARCTVVCWSALGPYEHGERSDWSCIGDDTTRRKKINCCCARSKCVLATLSRWHQSADDHCTTINTAGRCCAFAAGGSR